VVHDRPMRLARVMGLFLVVSTTDEGHAELCLQADRFGHGCVRAMSVEHAKAFVSSSKLGAL